jgi:hypothetical protein
MIKSICVFASSSPSIDQCYFETARQLGTILAERQIELIYGGGKNGLMGALAESVKSGGGKVTGIIPETIHRYGVAFPDADEMILTQTLRDRKALMEQRSDAFIALPGGFGTLEELLEIITLKQLGYHHKPIMILNSNHFYNPLQNLFDHLYHQGFAHASFSKLYYIAGNVVELFDYLDHYEIENFPSKLSSG